MRLRLVVGAMGVAAVSAVVATGAFGVSGGGTITTTAGVAALFIAASATAAYLPSATSRGECVRHVEVFR